MQQVSHLKYRRERSAELVAACDVTGNSISAVFYDVRLERRFARSVTYGFEVTPENVASELVKLFVTAVREYAVKPERIKRVGIASPVFAESALERGALSERLGVSEECAIDLVPFISAEINGRFTAMLLTLPDEDYTAVGFGRSLCAAVRKNGELRCFGAELGGAFDGSAFGNGIPAENGAINLIRRQDGATVYEVVGDCDSIGVSPCGALTAVNEMVKNGIIDCDGIMTDRDMLFIGEDYFISQNDIRAVQSDKARTAAAFALLPDNCGKVYFSGEPFSIPEGFQALLGLNAVPEAFRGASFTRNSTEQGIIRFLTDKSAEAYAYELPKTAVIFAEKDIQKASGRYLNYLNF